MTPDSLVARLRAWGLSPRKIFGQHFLQDPRILSDIAAAAEVGAGDRVLEVGTGPGTLTRELARRAEKVLTVEVDPAMLEFARRELQGFPNVEFLNADVLEGGSRLREDVVERLRALEPFVWVSNLPYHIATTLVVLLCESGLTWSRAALTVQAEVAERLSAPAGTGPYGPVSALVAYWADCRAGRKIPPGAFWPPPRVDSRVIVLRPRAPLGTVAEYPSYRAWVRRLFQGRRKQVRGLLRQHLGPARTESLLSRLGWNPAVRPERLTPSELLCLARAVPLEAG